MLLIERGKVKNWFFFSFINYWISLMDYNTLNWLVSVDHFCARLHAQKLINSQQIIIIAVESQPDTFYTVKLFTLIKQRTYLSTDYVCPETITNEKKSIYIYTYQNSHTTHIIFLSTLICRWRNGRFAYTHMIYHLTKHETSILIFRSSIFHLKVIRKGMCMIYLHKIHLDPQQYSFVMQ